MYKVAPGRTTPAPLSSERKLDAMTSSSMTKEPLLRGFWLAFRSVAGQIQRSKLAQRSLARGLVTLLFSMSLLSTGYAKDTASTNSLAQDGPKAFFTYKIERKLTSARVLFNASESADTAGITRYQWRFGDGTFVTGAKAVEVNHSYPLGVFKVSLTVTNSKAQSASYSTLISMLPSAEDVLAQPTKSLQQPRVLPTSNADSNVVAALDSSLQQEQPKLRAPEPLAPEMAAVLHNGMNVSFVWAAEKSADLYDFRVLNRDGEEAIRVGEFAARSICRGKRCRLRQEIDLEFARKYTWHVRVHNSQGWSEWSSTSFSVLPEGLTKPKMPLILYPGPNASVVKDETVTFLWSHHSATESYRFQLVNRDSGKILLDTRAQQRLFCDPQQCAYPRPIKLREGNRYAWQIQAANKAGDSGWFRNSFAVIASDKPERPVASFSYKKSADEDMSIEFDASASTASSTIVNYEWSFGDGMGATGTDERRVNHRFAESGSYFVTLSLVDGAGNQGSVQQLVHIGDGVAPTAQFLANDSDRDISGAAPFTVTFDPAGSSDDTRIVDYTWNFGDGSDPVSNAEAAIVSHSYTVAGEFVVSLTVTDETNLKSIHKRRVVVKNSVDAISASQAGLFLSQSTFGATDPEIRRLMEVGVDAWLAEQFTEQGVDHLNYVEQFSVQQGRAARHEIWWQDVIRGKDQLRQRVAFALSQIFHLSDSSWSAQNSGHAVTALYDLLRQHAFGNYRDLLEAVTLNPAMALHSGMLSNAVEQSSTSGQSGSQSQSRIDEKYAQLLLRRFTIGERMLGIDGVESSTSAYPTLAVREIARALTGWNVGGLNEWIDLTEITDTAVLDAVEWHSSLQPFDEMHDRDSKRLLGDVVTPPDLTPRQDLQLVLDNVFAHPNVGPYVSKQLIQQLVTSNPSADYIKRVATVFNDNGAGVRGDLKAVLSSILLDPEARTLPRPANFGRLREPVMRLAHLWRAFRVQPGTASEIGELTLADTSLQELAQFTGQAVFSNPTVRYPDPELHIPGGPVKKSNLVAPGFEMFSTNNARAVDALINEQIYRHFSGTPHSDDLQVAYIDFTTELELAGSPNRLLSRLNSVLLNGLMSDELANILETHLLTIPDSTSGRLKRVQDAVSLILSSPDYIVQM